MNTGGQGRQAAAGNSTQNKHRHKEIFLTHNPLDGIRVLDLSRVLAGPLCTQYLGDMGAEVIKVEDVEGGDESRGWPVFRHGKHGERTSTGFLSVNRNKRAIAIDLKTAAGRELVQTLARRCDVFVESFAPGVSERLGVDAATLRALNPRLIHCSITGFGTQGPLRHGKGYDLILQAFSGMLSVTGDAGSPPMRSPFSPVDQGTGLHATIGILAALHARNASGAGCSVEASLFDTSAAFLGYFLQTYWETKTEPVKAGVGHSALCPYGIFETADRPIIIGVANDALWRKFCVIAGLGDMPDAAQFSTTAQRVARRAQTEAIVQAALSQRGRTHWFTELDNAGIPCSPVHTLGEFVTHPHTLASGMVASYEDPHFGTLNGIAQPLRLDGERGSQRHPPPQHGEHTVTIMREAGLDEDAIARLLADAVVRDISQAESGNPC
jgi:crotonobetainyl-CoA:carnitine CoA-transferase CaiB-like acyl-CoA transferase